MKIVSFNVNGIRARIHQLEKLIDKHSPDIIGLQETKVDNENFPLETIKNLGYEVIINGQKGHYGVCLMSKINLLIMALECQQILRMLNADLYG